MKGAVLYGTKGIYALLLLMVGVLIAREHGADGFGQYTLLVTTIAFAVPIGSLGANYAMIEWVPKLDPDEMRRYAGRVISAVFVVSVLLTFVVAAVLAALGTSLWVLAWLLVPATLRVVLIGYLQGRARQVTAAVIDGVVLPLLLCLGLLVASTAGWELAPALLFGMGGSYVAAVIVAFIALRDAIQVTGFSTELWSDPNHRRALAVYSLIALLSPLVAQIDRYFVAGFHDAATVGPYAAAQNLNNLVVYGMTAAVALILPVIAAGLAGTRPLEEMIATCKRFGRVIFLFSLFGLLVAIFAGEWLLSWFGAGFEAAHASFIVLMAGLAMSLVFGLPMSVLTLSRHRLSVITAMGVAAVLTVVACLVLIPQLGILGAAIANAIGMVSSRAIAHWLLLRKHGFHVGIL